MLAGSSDYAADYPSFVKSEKKKFGAKIPNYYDMGVCLDFCVYHFFRQKYPKCKMQPEDFILPNTADDDEECKAEAVGSMRRKRSVGSSRVGKEGQGRGGELASGSTNDTVTSCRGSPASCALKRRSGKGKEFFFGTILVIVDFF